MPSLQQQQLPSSSSNGISMHDYVHRDLDEIAATANTSPLYGWHYSAGSINDALAWQTNYLVGYISHWLSHLTNRMAKIKRSIAEQGAQISQLHGIVESLYLMSQISRDINDVYMHSQLGHLPPNPPPSPSSPSQQM